VDKLENQVLQYKIAIEAIRAEYQDAYDYNRGKNCNKCRSVGGADPIEERRILARMKIIDDKKIEAIRQRDEFKKIGICEDIEKTVATERIKELEEIIKLSEEQLILSGEELKLSVEEFSTVKAKHQTLTNQYIIAIAGIVLIGILLFLRRKA
jgi:hypothetical protein